MSGNDLQVSQHRDDHSASDRTLRRGVVAVIAAVGLVPFGIAAFATLPTASTQAADVVPATAPPPMTKKWVALNTNDNTVTLNAPSATTPLGVQTISGSSCLLNQGASAGRVLSFTSVGGNSSYAGGLLGVQEKKSGTGTSCSQVNAVTNESLTLSVGDLTKGTLGAGALMTSAYLDVDLKQSASIRARVYKGNVEQGTGFLLQSGTSITGTPSLTVRQCNAGADSGSDAKAGDNCRWPISVPSWTGADDGISFDTITLEALTGSFSLLGGSDGLVPDFPSSSLVPTAVGGSSVFEVVDGVVNCGGQTRTLPAAADAPEVTVYRLNNLGNAACSALTYSLTSGPLFAQFLKPLDDQPGAQFVWEVKWRLAYDASASTLPPLTINYDTPDGNGNSPEVELGWCPDSTYQATAPYYSGYSTSQVASFPDQDDYAGKQFACVIRQEAVAKDGGSGDDYVAVRDLIYVLGDATMRR